MVQKAMDSGVPATEILNKGLVVGMTEVGVRFKAGEMFVPEVLMSAEVMHEGVELMRDELSQAESVALGKILLGTVKGDLHDIGKNLVTMMLEGQGFEVVDLGVSVEPARFVEAVKAHKAKFLALSALLTTTMTEMENTINSMEKAGLRNVVKIIVGGAPVTQDFADRIGADGYSYDSPGAAKLCKELLS